MKISSKDYLDKLEEKSVWVFTKQETDFDASYLASKLFAEIPDIENTNVEQYFNEHHENYNIDSSRHRMLVISQLFGLITKTPFYQRGIQYSKERPTAVYDVLRKILSKNNGQITRDYNTLKTEQILKLKIHAIIDTANNNEDYHILPVIFIYKVLKELQQRYCISEISINQLYTYVMTCKSYEDISKAIEFIKNNEPVSDLVPKFKNLSRVLTCINKNTKLFNITSTSISINNKFDEYFNNNFMLKYDLDELSETLIRNVDYSYFLYNVQEFGVNLIDEPECTSESEIVPVVKEVIKVETTEKDDVYYETKIDEIKENNINQDVAIGAYKVAPTSIAKTKISKRFKRNPLLGKIAIRNSYYCCEKDSYHETFISERTKKNFMEAHHLVPIMYQQKIWDKYHVNVDCVENIVSLCPTCHRAFHNGTKEVKIEMIENLYVKLLPRYKLIGFDITLEDIKILYNIE